MRVLINSSILRIIPSLIIIFTLCIPVQAKYGGGTGEPNDPYQIATAEHLMLLGETPGDYDKHFILTAGIDLDPNLPGRKIFDRAVVAPDTNDSDDWFQGTPFAGVFNGNGHTISHLTITGRSCLGLFGRLSNEARLSNLGLNEIDVNGIGSYLGGLCGANSGNISDCYATARVTGGDGSADVGGLCGPNWGAISNCYATGSVTGGDGSVGLGGLCGWNWVDGILSNCYATASVTYGDNSGGLGGLCGGNHGTISNCFWDKQKCGTLYSSGGWGMSTVDMMTESTYIGWNNGAWVIDEGQDYPHLAWENTQGAIIDYEHPRNYPGNGEDQPFELERPEDIVCISLRPDDWDKNFVLVSDIDMSSIIDYRPVELFKGSFNGQGHIVENLTIDANVTGNNNLLGLFGRIGLGGQVANLGLLDVNVIGPSFSLFLSGLCGQNDGTISNCYATGSVSGGQFLGGLCGDNRAGIISNCYATGSVSGASYLGGLSGHNSNNISNCYAIVNVSGGVGYSPALGGLCGRNGGGGTISNCYATGSVTGGNGSEGLGGLVGENSWGTILNCYATGSVSGGDFSSYLGGLVGENSWGGTISNCYATGSVTGGMWGIGGLCGENWSDVITCFWDIETSGRTESGGGIGLTTADMQTANTFLEANWDFVDEVDNGTDDIWWIDEGQDYPRLWWELIPEN